MLYGHKKILHMERNALHKRQCWKRKHIYKRRNRQKVRIALQECRGDLSGPEMSSYPSWEVHWDGHVTFISRAFLWWALSKVRDRLPDEHRRVMRSYLRSKDRGFIAVSRLSWHRGFAENQDSTDTDST